MNFTSINRLKTATYTSDLSFGAGNCYATDFCGTILPLHMYCEALRKYRWKLKCKTGRVGSWTASPKEADSSNCLRMPECMLYVNCKECRVCLSLCACKYLCAGIKDRLDVCLCYKVNPCRCWLSIQRLALFPPAIILCSKAMQLICAKLIQTISSFIVLRFPLYIPAFPAVHFRSQLVWAIMFSLQIFQWNISVMHCDEFELSDFSNNLFQLSASTSTFCRSSRYTCSQNSVFIDVFLFE